MRLKILLPFIFCATLAACGTATQQPQSSTQPATANDAANRQLIIDICEAEAPFCNCLADNLIKTFTPKEWNLFRAALNDPEPPEGTTQQDIQQMTNKLDSAAQACGQ